MIKKKHNELKIKVIGIGDCGIGAIGKINSSDSVDTIAIYRHFFFYENKAKYSLEIREDCGGLDGGPDKGEEAAENSKKEIANLIKEANVVFIISGMGGNTGSGASPVIAKIARELNILTIAIVTQPYHFEGKNRIRNAKLGIINLCRYSDVVIEISNNKIIELYQDLTMEEAWTTTVEKAIVPFFNVLCELFLTKVENNIICFNKIRNYLIKSGMGYIGYDYSDSNNDIASSVKRAIKNPYLDKFFCKAKNIIVSVYNSRKLSDDEINKIKTTISIYLIYSNIIIFQNVDEKYKNDNHLIILGTDLV